MHLYFDVLPAHPRPGVGESFTGYLTRIAELNRLRSVDSLALTVFPDQSRRVTRALSDFPPLSLASVEVATACPPDLLRRTTFFHLGSKFARSVHPQALSRFLSSSLVTHRRFCPLCLAASPAYHRLIWRFRDVLVCPEHQCALCDRCPACQQEIPLLKAPLRVGICPYCHTDLRSAPVQPATPDPHLLRLLDYLLTPQPWEVTSAPIIRALGRELLQRRLQLDCNGRDAAAQMGISYTALEGIERGDVNTRGGTFRDYLAYAAFLGVDLHSLFTKIAGA